MNVFDLQITHGASFSMTVSLTDDNNAPIDLTSLNVKSYIKSSYGESGYLTSLNPQVITPTSGIISLSIGASGSTGIPIGISFYDVMLNSGDTSFVALAGKVYVSPSVSFAPYY